MKLRLGLGFSDVHGGVVITPPTDITISNSTVPEDLAVGLTVGTIYVVGSPSTLSIILDADNKFALVGNELTIDHALDYETATSHAVTIRAENDAGFYDEILTIMVTNVADESTTPDLDPATVTPVYSGTFDVNPVVNKSNGKAKAQGKASSLASIILDIGAITANTTYIARVDPDFSLLSNTGKDAMVGFGLKSGNNFHLVGLKGNGSSGLTDTKVFGNWNGLNGATVSTGSAPTNGTQAGPNWIKITVAANGSTYTFYTGVGTVVADVVWTAEYTAATPSPLTNASDATTFGVAIYLPASDTGQFSLEIDAWVVDEVDPSFANVVLLLSGDGTNGSTTFTDDSSGHKTTSSAGGESITTSSKKFGTGSIDCAGAGIEYNDHNDFTLGSSNSDPWTIECWINPDTLGNGQLIMGQHNGSDGFFGWTMLQGNNAGHTDEIRFQFSTDGTFASVQSVTASVAGGLSAGTWAHCVVNHNSSGKIRLFINGVMKGSATPGNSAIPNLTTKFSIGSPSGAGNGSQRLDGKLDEIRITKGVCRYDSDSSFSVPARAFPRH